MPNEYYRSQAEAGSRISRRRVLWCLEVGAFVLAGTATLGGLALISYGSSKRAEGVQATEITPIATPGSDYIYRGHSAAVTTVARSPDGR
ncbi:MAG TPA: hypothetical protein VH593_02560 [Ktedonobacteraceae bacterium]